MKKKGQIQAGLVGLATAVVLLVVLGLMLTFTSDVADDVRNDQVDGGAFCNASSHTGCGWAYNMSEDALAASNIFSEKQSTVANVIIAGVIITILLAAFGVFLTRRFGA